MSGKNILIIGLGNIGSSLAKVLIRRNIYNVSIWNRSIEKCNNLFTKEEINEESLKYNICNHLNEGITSSDIIVISLFDYNTSYKVFNQDSNDINNISSEINLLKGKIVIQLTSSIPSESMQWKTLLDSVNAINIDGCVIGWPSMVGSESFSLLLSGCSEETFNKYKPLFRIWGKPSYIGSNPGQADALDIAVLTYLQGIKFGFMQGLAFCEQAGVSLDQYTSFAKHYLNVYSSVLDDTTDKIKKRDYETQINTSVAILRKFNRNVIKHAKDTNQSTELLHAIDAPLTAVHNAGKDKIDQTSVFEYMLNSKSKFFDKE